MLLDRPNPLGGAAARTEGATQAPGFLSFVGLEPVPILILSGEPISRSERNTSSVTCVPDRIK